jgi:uncharacterized protein
VSRSPWLVPVTVLRRSLGNRMVESRTGPVGELRVGDSVVSADVLVTAEAVLDSVDGGVEVTASVTAAWSGRCRRCLRPVGGTLSPQVRELYRQRHPGEPPDEETYPLVGEMLDLRPLVRDALLLDMPIAPLCGEGCRGLCPGCGGDLNEGDCSCPPAAPDPRWAVLDVLRPSAGGGSG